MGASTTVTYKRLAHLAREIKKKKNMMRSYTFCRCDLIKYLCNFEILFIT